MDKVQALINLGLSEKEARVYLALLRLRQASAYKIAQKAGVKKPTAYVLLDELMKKELVLKLPGERTQMYMAKSPHEFFANAQNNFRMASQVMPDILSLAREQDKVRTMYFEGERGVRQAAWYGMEENANKEFVGFFALANNIGKEMRDLTWKWAKDTREHNITIRGFAPKHTTIEDYRNTDEEYQREIRTLPIEEYSSETSMEISDTFVRIFDPTGDTPYAVIIENDRIAKMMKQIFEMLWKAKKE